MTINTEEDLNELNEKSNIIHRFLAEGQLDYIFSMYDNQEMYGLEHIFTVEMGGSKKMNICANTEGRIYFEIFQIKKTK